MLDGCEVAWRGVAAEAGNLSIADAIEGIINDRTVTELYDRVKRPHVKGIEGHLLNICVCQETS